MRGPLFCAQLSQGSPYLQLQAATDQGRDRGLVVLGHLPQKLMLCWGYQEVHQLAAAVGAAPADAKIVGDTVEVTAKGVDKPTAVRFGWVNFAKPDLNFGNKDGLPAVPPMVPSGL